MARIFSLLLFLPVLLLTFCVQAQSRVLLLTEEWKPFNFVQGTQIVGLSTELVESMFERAEIDYQIRLLPWSGAYQKALDRPEAMLFTTSRTEKREKLFKWIGPLYPRKTSLYKLKSRLDIQIRQDSDLKKYRIGVLQGGAVQGELDALGLKEDLHYFTVRRTELNIEKLFRDRADLIPGADLWFKNQVKASGFSPEEVQQVFVISDKGGYYLAANLQTPDEVVQKLQDALDVLIQEGLREKLINKYSQQLQ
ncbi:substrate-binding periplasmic protein [Dongshaea marina]|uniref:substrate-binding periplasmic protein n=1 Tax=Dongshaea marina TaxID=2047966 RepID=UPI00131ED9AF|nr:ABC transporter substrate-binding protein [Dongshaea marina]